MWTGIRLQLCLLLASPILRFIFSPKNPKFIITDASLTQFNLNHNKTLDYNLAFNITIINPNRNAAIFYSQIQAGANYRNKYFSLVTLPFEPFDQCGKNKTISHHVHLEGSKSVVFGEQEISQFNSETIAGVYSIDVRFYVSINIMTSSKFNTGYSNPSHKIDCKLKVPLQFGEASANHFTFKTTKCRSDISSQTLKQRAKFFLYNPTVLVRLILVSLFFAVMPG